MFFDFFFLMRKWHMSKPMKNTRELVSFMARRPFKMLRYPVLTHDSLVGTSLKQPGPRQAMQLHQRKKKNNFLYLFSWLEFQQRSLASFYILMETSTSSFVILLKASRLPPEHNATSVMQVHAR